MKLMSVGRTAALPLGTGPRYLVPATLLGVIMSTPTVTAGLQPNAEERRVATQQFDRARQATTAGNFDYGVELLLTCCQLDPGNLTYRRALRQAQKLKFENDLKGHPMAWLLSMGKKMKFRRAQLRGDSRRVLELGEQILSRNPWDTATQLVMAEAAVKLQLPEVGIYILEQARQLDPNDARVNRPLARLFEKVGQYTQAIAAWNLVAKADPRDDEAARKVKDLSATATIQRGGYSERTGKLTGDGSETERSTPLEPTSTPAARGPGSTGEMRLSAQEQQRQKEMENLRAKINADPTRPHAYLQLAQLHQGLNQFEQARTVLDQGLSATGRDFDLQLASMELDITILRQNLRANEARLRSQPENGELRTQNARLRKEITAREIDFYRQRADRFPSDYNSRLELGRRLLDLRQVDEAIGELQKARGDSRHRGRVLYLLGQAFQIKNTWMLAKRNYEEALAACDPRDDDLRKEVLFALAQGTANAGDHVAAVEFAQELANLDFNYRQIGKLLEEWQSRLAKLQR